MVLTGGHNGKLDDRTLESKAGFYQDGEMRGLPTGKENRDTSSRWGLAQQPINQPSGSMPKLPQCDSQTQDLCDMWEATQVPRLLRQALPEIYEMGESICDKTQSAFTTGSIRRLTPVETERLQAFPDNWTQYGISIHGEQVKISDTQRYKTMGNAVTTSVVTDIAMAINEAIGV
jgi:site-specific DNA-cytosine methylase